MRRVLRRRFGPLDYFVLHQCGCLVGTYALVRGDMWTRTSSCPPGEELRDIGVAVANLTDYQRPNGAYHRKRLDAVVVRLLKQRIRRALGRQPGVSQNNTLALTAAD
jgi:hypothetical protein